MKLAIQPRADRDLREAWKYIARDNESAADSYLDRLWKRLEILCSFPDAGTPRFDLRPKLRSWPLERHVAYYEPCEAEIRVIRILHGSQDRFDSMLFEGDD